MTTNKPLNNFNPNLVRKPQSPNLYNRQGLQSKGPVKIQKDMLPRKPGTPDTLTMMSIGSSIPGYTNKTPKYAPSRHYAPSAVKSKVDTGIKRPSTAPQKDKPKTGNKYSSYATHNQKSQTLKRAPSPMIHSSSTMSKTQKFNPMYRAPSPMIKSTSHLSNTYKKHGF